MRQVVFSQLTMNKGLSPLLLAVLCTFHSVPALSNEKDLGLSDWLPLPRQIDWSTAGLPGGLPDVELGANVLEFGAVADDNKDDWSAFQKAIESVQGKNSNAIVIPAGNFIISRTLKIKDSVVLRGAGAEQTHLDFTMKGNGIEAIGNDFGPWVKLTESVPFNASAIPVASIKGFSSGDIVEIQQQNDEPKMYTKDKWNVSWAQEAVGQLFALKKVTQDALHVSDATRIEFKRGLSATARRVNLIPWVGIEDLHVVRSATEKESDYTFYFKNTAYSWVSRVHSEDADTNHIGLNRVYKCEIRDSYFHDATDHGTGGNGYGVKLGFHVSGCLIENNVFKSLRHSMLLHLGANGNVLGYNYSYNSRNQSGKILPDIALHGHYPFGNLFEANIVEEIGFGDFWGPAGPRNTAFRNCVTKEGIWLQDESSGQAIVGNTIANLPESYIGFRDSSIIDDTLIFSNEPAAKVEIEQQALVDLRLSNVIGPSLYKKTKPRFYELLDWPSAGVGLNTDCRIPAFLRQHKIGQ